MKPPCESRVKRNRPREKTQITDLERGDEHSEGKESSSTMHPELRKSYYRASLSAFRWSPGGKRPTHSKDDHLDG